MGQGISLNHELFILLHTHSIVCATVQSQSLEYFVYNFGCRFEREKSKYVHTALQLLIKGGSVEETFGINSYQHQIWIFPPQKWESDFCLVKEILTMNEFKINCTHSKYIVDIHFFDLGINLRKFFTLAKIPQKGPRSLFWAFFLLVDSAQESHSEFFLVD